MGKELDKKYIKFIVQAICYELLFMHKNRRMLLYFKCENVLIARNGEIKLADLELAAKLVQEQNNRHTVKAPLLIWLKN